MSRSIGAIAASVCLIAAVAAAVFPHVGPADPVAMPTTPAWLAAAAAAAAGVLVARGPSPGVARIAAVGVCGACMGAGSVLALPHTILMVVVWTVNVVTGAEGSFEVAPSWSATLMHLAVLCAVLALIAWTVIQARRLRGRCGRCGRLDADPPGSGERVRARLFWLAALSVLGAAPYVALKIAWSSGARIGLVGESFADVSFASPGFGDTVAMSAVSVFVAVVMGLRVRQPVVRTMAAGVGGLAALMLVPVGATAMAMLIGAAAGLYRIDDSAIAPWAYIVVYLSFFVWGIAMTLLVWTYWRSTARRCGGHEVSAALR